MMNRFDRMIVACTVSYMIIEKPKLISKLIEAVIKDCIKTKNRARHEGRYHGTPILEEAKR